MYEVECVVVGAGVVGLAIARELLSRGVRSLSLRQKGKRVCTPALVIRASFTRESIMRCLATKDGFVETESSSSIAIVTSEIFHISA